MNKPFYVLREVWTETYDCPDNGLIDICQAHIDINISQNKKLLDDIAEQLNRGMGEYWSEKEMNRLRRLYSGYDCMKDSKYVVEDISDLFIE